MVVDPTTNNRKHYEMCKLFLFSLAKFTSDKNSSARRKRSDSQQSKRREPSPEHVMLIQNRNSCRCHTRPFTRCQGRSSNRCHRRSINGQVRHTKADKIGKRPLISEEHWTKVLQANEPHGCRCEFCNNRRPHRRRLLGSNNNEDRNETFWQNTTVVSLFARFCNWVSTKRKYHVVASGSVKHRHFTTVTNQGCDSITTEECSESEELEDMCKDSNNDLSACSFHEKPLPPFRSEQNCLLEKCPDNAIPNICAIDSEIRTAESTCCGKQHEASDGVKDSSSSTKCDISNAEKFQLLTVGIQRQPLTSSVSCPPKSEESSSERRPRLSTLPVLCATWPTIGRWHRDEDEDDDDLTFDDFCDNRVPKQEDENSLGDFAIPYSDLEIGECTRIGRSCSIYRGRWHGDVAIHCFKNPEDDDAKSFWSSVSKLCRIRHENVALFMGACVEKENLAVVTSVQTGVSLYEHIHMKQEKTSLHSKVQILRQIAQGMGYLHAKGIVMRKLNTRNVFLCPKVKLSVMDYGTAEKRLDIRTCGCIPRGHLTYVAPEILVTMRIMPPRLVTTAEYTNESDIYSFGTIVYEMITGHYPMAGVASEIVIWQICSGYRQNLDQLRTTRLLKSLIVDCWSHEPQYRPHFTDISKDLYRNASLHKRHSSSEPEKLNHFGLNIQGYV